MTHSKSWARRRAVQVLRAARLPRLEWAPGRVSVTDDELLGQMLNSLEWATFGGHLWHPNSDTRDTFDRVSGAMLKVQIMAGLHGA